LTLNLWLEDLDGMAEFMANCCNVLDYGESCHSIFINLQVFMCRFFPQCICKLHLNWLS